MLLFELLEAWPWAFALVLLVWLVARAKWPAIGRHLPWAARRQAQVCPRCTTILLEHDSVCEVCQWPHRTETAAAPAVVHRGLMRTVGRLQNLGLIRRTVAVQLDAAIRGALVEPVASQMVCDDVELTPVRQSGLAPSPERSATGPAPVAPQAPKARSPRATPDLQPVATVAAGAAARARQFAASRAAAASAPAPPRPARPKRDWGKLFSVFLQQNNILWGELVGGLLIVGCSIALVISFWSEIAERPLLKFGVFNGVSAALYAAGFYTGRRWKIHTTSQGVLVIATLLAPLNFLAIAALTSSSPPIDWLPLMGEGLSLALFTTLTYYAARQLTPHAPWATTACVMTGCLLQLAIRRFAGPEASGWALWGLAAAPALSFAGTVTFSLHKIRRGLTSDPQIIISHLVLLGLCLFATLLPWGLLLHKTGDPSASLALLAPLIVVLGAPLLATTLLLWNRVGQIRTMLQVLVGAAGALGGMAVVASVAAAWPLPATVLATAAVNALLWLVLARYVRLPVLDLPAAFFLGVCWLVAMAMAAGETAGNVPDPDGLIAAVQSASAGTRLAPLALAYAAIAGLSHWFGVGRSTRVWGQAAAAAGLASMALLGWHGLARLGDPLHVAGYYLVYALLFTIGAAALNRRWLSWGAAALLLVALLQATLFRYGAGWLDGAAWLSALLLHCSAMTAATAGVDRWRGGRADHFRQVASTAAQAGSVVAAGLWCGLSWSLPYDALWANAGWLAAVWLALSYVDQDPRWFVAFQTALAAAVAAVVSSQLAAQPWHLAGVRGWLDPWFLQAQATAVALLALLWRTARLAAVRSQRRLPEYVRTLSAGDAWAAFDRAVGVGVALLTIGLAIYAAIPGAAQELSPAVDAASRTPQAAGGFQLAAIAADHATGWGAWALWGATVVLVGVGCWDRRPTVGLLVLYALGMAACLQLATSFAAHTAVASAIRWFVGGYALTAALAIASRQQVRPWLNKVAIRLDSPPSWLGDRPAQAARLAVVGSVGVVYLAMAAFVSISTIIDAPRTPGIETLLIASSVAALAAGLAWLAIERLPLGGRWRGSTVVGNQIARLLLLIVGTLPLAVASTYLIAATLAEKPLLGPDPASWFGQLGNTLLYGGPLALFATVLLVFAIRESSSRYAFAFGLLSMVLATLAYLFELAKAQESLDAVAWLELAQLNSIVAAGIAMAWHAVTRRGLPDRKLPRQQPMLLQALAWLAAALCIETLLAGCWGIVASPDALTWQASVATWLGVAATLLSAAAVYVTTRPPDKGLAKWHVVGSTLLAVAALPCLAARFDTGALEAYHTFLVAASVGSWALAYYPASWRSLWGSQSLALATALTALSVLMRGLAVGDQRWWSIVAILSTSAVLVRTAAVGVRRAPLWLASPLLLIAGHLAFEEMALVGVRQYPLYLADITALLLSIAAAASIRVELSWARRRDVLSASGLSIGLHRVAGWLTVALMLLAAAVELFAEPAGTIPLAYGWSPVLALSVGLAATAYSLWDHRVRWPIAACYFLGLAGVGRFVGWLRFDGDDRTWAVAVASAAFVLTASYAWRRRQAIADWAIRLGAPPRLRVLVDQSHWILAVNCLLCGVTTLLATSILCLDPSLTHRMTAAYAVLACALAIAQMAVGRVETVLRYVALTAGAYFAVAFAWAWIPPSLAHAGLHRLVAAGVAVAAVVPVYGALLVKISKRETPWVAAAQRMLPCLIAAAGGLLLATLATEVWFFVNDRPLALQWPAVAAVALALAGLTASSLAAAIVPGRDPLELSERGRTAYVYAAELFAGLLLLHARVAMPWLFSGWFAAYWPAVVMLVAFLGVGLSEWFARRRQRVLAEPLGNTGLFLPLLPVLGFWTTSEAGQYALLLLSVGVLYVAISARRKSPLLTGVGLLALNGSLWTLLDAVEGWGFVGHPQFWLIPPAICILIGAELCRRQIPAPQLRMIRYGSAIMIYAASTADIFINGVGQGVWLPILLAGWSLAGVFVGILLRVRAFLLLGIAFLCVSVLTVVWHAAVQQHRTWIWWVAGMATGLIIIVLFGLFEKKRDEALKLIAQIRQWET